MIDGKKEEYKHSKKTVFNQMAEVGAIKMFSDLHAELCAYADENNIDSPGKGELLTWLLRESTVRINSEKFFSKKS